MIIYVIGNKEKEPERIQYLNDYFMKLGLLVNYFQPTYGILTEKELSCFLMKHMEENLKILRNQSF
jgi:hypothetical protein